MDLNILDTAVPTLMLSNQKSLLFSFWLIILSTRHTFWFVSCPVVLCALELVDELSYPIGVLETKESTNYYYTVATNSKGTKIKNKKNKKR